MARKYALSSWFCITCLPSLSLSIGLPAEVALAEILDCGDEGLSLMQKRVERTPLLKQSPGQAGNVSMPRGTELFKKVLMVSINPERYAVSEDQLEGIGVPSEMAEMVRGYNGSNPVEVDEALELLTRYGHGGSLHPTVKNWMVCMHTSPGKAPDLWSAFSELFRSLLHWRSPRNVSELLHRDAHNCVAKVIAIAAAHVRLWRDLADGTLPAQSPQMLSAPAADKDPWYLVMEDDVTFCPGWRQRMLEELPMAPPDADVIKLFFFGHWRQEDEVKNSSGLPSPFLEARDPLRGWDLFSSSLYEVLHGHGWSQVPIAGFYAGTQAYLIRPSGARKLLAAINGKPFQDIDMTMMSSVKNYVWRKVLVTDHPSESDDHVSLLQTVPTCNSEPARDQFR
eukprot:gb/GFBE01075355.1/.p1 GENE.gb/GFBE01075355.1/~~gb/GFBE01075355.1/.p1  ORF type:complete len:395 (+),score=50.53 gb/GFBE01075355.1/:1-1185(+)